MRHFLIKLRKILLYDSLYLILLLFSIIYIVVYINLYKNESKYSTNCTKFNLKIKDYKIDGDKLSIDFFDEVIGVYYFKNILEKESFNYSINDELSIAGSLKVPSNNTIPNTFNYKKYLQHNKKNYILNIDSIKLKRKNNNILYKIKNYIINRINSIDTNGYLYAFILGKTNYLNNDIYNNYRINGITHLFALSGLHVSVFSSILLYIFNKIKLSENASYLITIIFLITFSFVASFTPSILRATLFFILSSINKIYYFYIKPKNILYLVFMIMIFINPFYIYNTGFLLSFIITYFILLYNENHQINNKLISILKISILSMLSSFPIVINMSYEINIVGFFNNLFFIPFVSYIVFPLTILCTIFNKLTLILNFFINIMESISMISSSILNITLIFSKLSIIEIIVYYIFLISIIKYKNKTFYVCFLIYMIIIYFYPEFDKNTYIYYLDVGQGDSALIVNGNHNSILIDTGGKVTYEKEEWKMRNNEYNNMNSSLIPFFKSLGLTKINYFIITHGDFDHMGEAINLVNNFKVEKVIFNCGPYNDLEKELIKVLDEKKIKYYSCIKELNIDKNKLYFLQTKEYDNENDNSNVIYTELYGYKFLFMGDASVTTEKEILSKYNLPDIDVLKVGHHGSKTSSSKEFTNEINPKYSIISVGKNNRYGHPNKEVLDNLNNSKIYRTDQDGSIKFKIQNNKLKIETCSP